MSKIIAIPVRAYAIVADEAAFLLSERVADIFDCDAPSRARLVAIASMIRLYPGASCAHLALNFGYGARADCASTEIAHARRRNWWRPADVEHVVKVARRALGLEIPAWKRGGEETDFAPARSVPPIEKAAPPALFTPRKAARLCAPPPMRRANVTAALLGDPTPEQRAAMAARPGDINGALAWTRAEADLRRKYKVAEMGL